MSTKYLYALLAIATVVLTIPTSVYYTIKILERFKNRKKQTSELVKRAQDDKLPSEMPFRTSGHTVTMIHLFALFGVCVILRFMIETVTIIPQRGFGGPLPRWGGCLIFMPISGLICNWICLSLTDTLHCLYPKDWVSRKNFKNYYTKSHRDIMSIGFFMFGMLLPWSLMYPSWSLMYPLVKT